MWSDMKRRPGGWNTETDRHRQSQTQEKGCRESKLWSVAMQPLIEEELHSPLLTVHFLYTKKPLKQTSGVTSECHTRRFSFFQDS